MKTWEVIKALTENPKAKFHCKYKNNIGGYDVQLEEGRLVCYGNQPYTIYVFDKSGGDVEWELVPQPVSFMEAIKAYSEGNTIRCELLGDTTKFVQSFKTVSGHPEHIRWMIGHDDTNLSAGQILNGKWFIE